MSKRTHSDAFADLPSPSPERAVVDEEALFLDLVKEAFSKSGAQGTSYGEVLISLFRCDEDIRQEIKFQHPLFNAVFFF